MQAARRAPVSPSRSRWPVPVAAALLGLGLDQLTKSLAVAHLTPGEPKHLIGSLLQLHITRNPGAAFSTGTGMTAVLSCIAIVAALVVAWFALVKARSPLWALALGLLEAGILGNVVDRIFREPSPLKGHVVDFLELPHWPIFNIADCCITVAAILIVIQAMRGVKLDGTLEPKATA
ncbi:signal peptidase II [Nocardioides sp. Kera G14]|uniref:signal peptidase II n=1 Tax=Nocardioides sp. Kera G14 TaxID=2884264 RepID=UPI001D12A8BD|nr:signal peptidase II [Nocardioides sp. Kera G14]UDY22478.1 signal peptidase II [Nocardioides sp. Kera G14]